MVTPKTQDLPPPGGYQKIPFMRVPAKTLFNGFQIIGAYIGITTFAVYIYHLTNKQIQREEVEMRSARLALMPMLIAERDREFLKQVRKNRDEEARLMKNIPGWVVGTYYGEPIYKTKPVDHFDDNSLSWDDLCVHSDYRTQMIRQNFHLWN
ncbi:hypothetical protein PVAND_004871 [Polypedilum vanderplanki]|uniref:NADH dehydrogenase [ubiquinone] 1 alpha subcomplex subunit 13 n=1 Tax=Polypedilum vanderplanki TaxID=319348 RepID=A0A9J6C0C8_POLVA|nr:hypothetical protein PVAND_004871 [Polypedilum vanderplanki]